MNTFKKLFTLLLIVSVLALAACDGGNSEVTTPADTTAATEAVTTTAEETTTATDDTTTVEDDTTTVEDDTTTVEDDTTTVEDDTTTVEDETTQSGIIELPPVDV